MVIIEQGGKITFLYNKVPELPYNFVDEHHPVTIGLADAHRQKVNFLDTWIFESICAVKKYMFSDAVKM